MKGGANGARIRLAPQKFWEVNDPPQLKKVLETYEKIQSEFSGDISLADLIVFGGNVGVENAAKEAGHDVSVPFSQGRVDATQDQTDVEAFSVLDPPADGFRNYQKAKYSVDAEHLLVDRAQLLTLTTPEMTVLVGGLRVLGANTNGSKLGVFTDKVGVLTNDYFTNLLDMDVTWKAVNDDQDEYIGTSTKTGAEKWRGSRVDLVFGSNSILRAVAEVYGSSDSSEKFVKDFVKAWAKVMDLDRFDLRYNNA
jgi:catalase-peroxidase